MTKTTGSASSSAPSSPTQVQYFSDSGAARHQPFANLAALSAGAGSGSVTATPMDVVVQRQRALEPGMLMHASNSSWPGFSSEGFVGGPPPLQRPTPVHSESFGMSSVSLENRTAPTATSPAGSSMRQQPSLPGDSGKAVVAPVAAGHVQATARPHTVSRQRSASQPQGRNRALSASDDGNGKKRLQSCDICRIRKVKCVRPDDAASLATGKCKQCLANHAKCTYAYVPKKPGPQTSSAKALARREDKERQVQASAAASALTKGTSSSSSSAGSSNYHARASALAAKRRGSEHYTVSSGGEHSSSSSRKSSFIEHMSSSQQQQQQHGHPTPQQQYAQFDYFADQYSAQPASAPPTITSMQFHQAGSNTHLPSAMVPQWVTHGFAQDVLTPLHGAHPLESQLPPGLDLMHSPHHGVYHSATSMPMVAGGQDVLPAGLPFSNHAPSQPFSPTFQQQPSFQPHHQSPFVGAATASADVGGPAAFGVQRAACLHTSPPHSSDSRPSTMSMLYGPGGGGGGGGGSSGGEQDAGGPGTYTGLSSAGTPSSYLADPHASTPHWTNSMLIHDPSALSTEHLPHRPTSAQDVGPPPQTGNSEEQWSDMWHFTAPPPS